MVNGTARRTQLGDFLQAIRTRSQPAAFGFAAGNRRRTAGLRREEMAQLIGISPTWYTWIEQGREVNVSADVLDRLATNLRLNHSERDYLFEMAGRRDPQANQAAGDEVQPLLIDLLADIAVPAYLMGRYWDILGWNTPAAELFAGWLEQPNKPGGQKGEDEPLPPEVPPNMLRYVFLSPQARVFLFDWEARARRIAAEFRADCRRRLDDPGLSRLIEELSTASPDFARLWKQHVVLERQGGERVFLHPSHGPLRYQQVTLRLGEQEHLKLVMLRPAPNESTVRR